VSAEDQNLVMNMALPIMGGHLPRHEAFWGDYYGEFKDKFGISWMIVCSSTE
jgi:hypothetical protein